MTVSEFKALPREEVLLIEKKGLLKSFVSDEVLNKRMSQWFVKPSVEYLLKVQKEIEPSDKEFSLKQKGKREETRKTICGHCLKMYFNSAWNKHRMNECKPGVGNQR